MNILPRVALAALLAAAVALPAMAQVDHAAPPAPKHPIARVAAGTEAAKATKPDATKPDAAKSDAGKPTLAKPAEKPAVATEKTVSHAPATPATPPAGTAVAPKTN